MNLRIESMGSGAVAVRKLRCEKEKEKRIISIKNSIILGGRSK